MTCYSHKLFQRHRFNSTCFKVHVHRDCKGPFAPSVSVNADDRSKTTLIEINGLTPKWVATPL